MIGRDQYNKEVVIMDGNLASGTHENGKCNSGNEPRDEMKFDGPSENMGNVAIFA